MFSKHELTVINHHFCPANLFNRSLTRFMVISLLFIHAGITRSPRTRPQIRWIVKIIALPKVKTSTHKKIQKIPGKPCVRKKPAKNYEKNIAKKRQEQRKPDQAQPNPGASI
jgi:hypothetical protein